MLNLLLFLGSCGLVAAFAWYFWFLGQSPLTAWIAILSLLANLFVLKQIELLGFNATASDVFAIGSLLGLNLLQERYGAKATQQAIWASFTCLIFFVLMSQIHLDYVPSEYDQSQVYFAYLLNPAPRIVMASLVTFFIVQQFDAKIYQLFRRAFPTFSAILVSSLSLCLSQLLDTLLFSLLGLYGLIQALIEVMIVSYAIKIIAIANTVPWSYITQKLLQRQILKNDVTESH